MRKRIFAILSLSVFLLMCQSEKKDAAVQQEKNFVDKGFTVAKEQLKSAINQYQDLTQFPRSTNPDGSLNNRPASNWTSGFFPGCLWLMYDYSNDEKFKNAAIKWTEALNEVQFNTGTHDVGFIINCSYGHGLKMADKDEYKPVMIEAAKSLSTRYNENVGCTKSWDWSDEWQFPVIVDNMMNMELLFEVSKLTDNESFKKIAIDHAYTTVKNHYRPDYSSYHVVDYDPETGEVLDKFTHQGYNAESDWARGQAWGLYGFTMCYRETQDSVLLTHAENIAQFLINHPNTPDDLIPYWDYDAPGIPNEPRDASGAAIMASALLELSTYSEENSDHYFNYAEKILKGLASDKYLATPGTNNNFILKHCTGNKPADSEVDVPLIYGDYYFLEALLRYQELTKNE